MRQLWLVYLASDVIAIAAAYSAAFALRFRLEWGKRIFEYAFRLLGVREPVELGPDLDRFYLIGAPRIILILAVTVCCLYAFMDMYAGRRFIRRRPVAWTSLLANAAALGLFFSYFYVRWNVFHPRSMFATIAVLNVILCTVFRSLTATALRLLRRRFNIDDCRAVLVGSGNKADLLVEFIDVRRPHGIRVADRVDSRNDPSGLTARIAESVATNEAHLVILADEEYEASQIMEVLDECTKLGVATKVLTGKMDVIANQASQSVDMIKGMPLIHFGAPRQSELHRLLARAVSAVMACVALVLLAPLLGLIVLVVRITSHGRAIFMQDRIGLNRQPFKMYKIRTMHDLADEVQSEVEALNESGKTLFKVKADPRVTMVGRALRRFSLDELPQLMNVVRGEMTLVGPRPLPLRDFENYYEHWHYLRHNGMPGLTGLWQVSGRSDIDFHNMCILDMYYLRNQSPMLDLKIILKTIWVVLFARGAY